jgi:ATP-binding cassette subfamily B protein
MIESTAPGLKLAKDNDSAAKKSGEASLNRLRDKMHGLKHIRPYIELAWNADRRMVLISLSLRFVRAIIPVAMLYVGKLIVDDVASSMQGQNFVAMPGGWLASASFAYLVELFAIEFVLAILADVLGRLGSLVDSLLSERLSNAATTKLMRHAAELDLADFENADFQDRLDRARHQTTGGMTLLAQVFNQAQSLVTVLTLTASLAFYAPWLIVLLFVTLLPAFMGEAHFNALGYAMDFARTPERREMDYIRQTASSAETAKEVKIFELKDFLLNRYMKLASGFYAAHRNLAYRRASWGSLFSSVGTGGYYIAYAYIAWRTLNRDFTIGDLAFLAGSFQRLRGLMEGLLAEFSSTAAQALYLKDLFSFFDTKPQIMAPPDPRPFPKPLQRGFVFENVGFKYPGTARWAIRNLDLELRAGEVLALVGENGSGKTTLVKLLARLYEPTEGRIYLDGHDLKSYDPRDLRDNIGVIFQDFVRYNMTARENIAVGKITEKHDEVRIHRAANKAQIDKVISRLGGGYDQMIGKGFGNGVDLSGGEWQRMAIARAYNRQAEILILDEPTSALDARAEFEVFKRFKDLSVGKTAILISHRLSSVRMADRIVVLANGQIEACGTHEELMEGSGRYAELFELQASGYR